ncbi:MAG TPA: hypothetical protein DCX89_06800 [Saprospirales bacterium]|nr:hypothetical protein [Saprospirales bacterium]HRQ29025.1 hypothetical protein [Saprospiraceae bacterium]
MRIHSLANLIAFPFMVVTGIILYFLFFEDKESYYLYLFAPVIILVIIYTYSPKINFWWHKKHPPKLDPKLKLLVEQSSLFYNKLDEKQKQKYLDRLSIFIHHKSFSLMRKEKEELPIDVRTLFSINGITLTFHKEEYFFDKYDYFIAYGHPFPSPRIRFLHSVETDHEDGTVVFNLRMLFDSMIRKTGHFNIGLFAFTDLYKNTFPDTNFPELTIDQSIRLAVKDISGVQYEKLLEDIGYEPEDLHLILVPLYFEHPDSFQLILPAVFSSYQKIFSS